MEFYIIKVTETNLSRGISKIEHKMEEYLSTGWELQGGLTICKDDDNNHLIIQMVVRK